MSKGEIFRIDGILWLIKGSATYRFVTPLCPKHHLKMKPEHTDRGMSLRIGNEQASVLKCAEGPHSFDIPRSFVEEEDYVMNRIDATELKNMEVVDLDGQLTPITKKVKDKNDKYFASTQLLESKRGLQLVVYAGERGRKEKTQIFIDPKTRRLSFDQNDLHPNDLFLELNATFDDGSIHTMKKSIKKRKNA